MDLSFSGPSVGNGNYKSHWRYLFLHLEWSLLHVLQLPMNLRNPQQHHLSRLVACGSCLLVISLFYSCFALVSFSTTISSAMANFVLSSATQVIAAISVTSLSIHPDFSTTSTSDMFAEQELKVGQPSVYVWCRSVGKQTVLNKVIPISLTCFCPFEHALECDMPPFLTCVCLSCS